MYGPLIAALALPVWILGCSTGEAPPLQSSGMPPVDLDSYFAKRVDVFGIPVHATANAPVDKVLHGAAVLAQFLDNDEDGRPDDPFLVETLARHDGRLFMSVDRDELDAVFEQIEVDHPGTLARTAWWLNEDGITGSDWSWQDLATEETVLLEDRVAGAFDGALEEVLHLVSHVGLANAYPEAFAEAPGSRLADAMDVMRGGRFLDVPDRYPDDAVYVYYDETCVYQCQATEYFYWALTSLLGGQAAPERLAEVGEEWPLNTREKLERDDPAIYSLLTDPQFELPTVLPTGVYEGGPLEIVSAENGD